MASSLDILKSLSSNAENPDNPIQVELAQRARLDEMKRSLGMVSDTTGGMDKWGNPTGTSFGTGATPADARSLQSDVATAPYTGDAAQEARTAEAVASRPGTQQMNAQTFAQKMGLAIAPNQAKATGDLAVTKAEIAGKVAAQQQQEDATQKLIKSAQNSSEAGTTFKPAINAQGGVSFTETQMPALVQRAHNQLIDARDKTLSALQEAERMYPGINDSSTSADQQPSGQGWGSFLTGIGGQKYGSATDMVGAANERLKYTVGVPTPFSKLAQEASFGNIEQMAGQLPGVRGLATITPMFKEHQSRWGHETPLATVQRLRHMAQIMDETIHTIEGGGGNPQEPQ
jgi:hypothetical protein